jgi:hypothetical protein
MANARPPRAGWVLLRPHDPLIIDLENPALSIHAHNGKVMQLRGAVLSSAFNLENILETLLAEFLFPSPASGEDLLDEKRSLFRLDIFRDLNFERKTRIASDVAKKILRSEEAEALATALGNVRQLRNLMAHYPCWLEPIRNGQMLTGYRIFIEKGKSSYEVSDDQISDWLAMVTKTLVMEENTLRRLTGTIGPDHPLDQPLKPSSEGRYVTVVSAADFQK